MSTSSWLPSSLFEPPDPSEFPVSTSSMKSKSVSSAGAPTTTTPSSLPSLRNATNLPVSLPSTSLPRAPGAPRFGASALKQSHVEQDHHAEVVRFLLEAKGNDVEAALEFLRRVFLTMTSSNGRANGEAYGAGPPYFSLEEQAAAQAQLVMFPMPSLLTQAQSTGTTPRPPPFSAIRLIRDEIDTRVVTLVILAPGKDHIVGHLIGKGGAEVGRIERDMGVTVKIESVHKHVPPPSERVVCIVGAVSSATLAQQHVSHKIHEKLLSDGVQAEVLKIVVPNESVKHLIGKSGSMIQQIQNESGAMIQFEQESLVLPNALGRCVLLQGSERCRTYAQYLIVRFLAEANAAEWSARVSQYLALKHVQQEELLQQTHHPSPPPPQQQQQQAHARVWEPSSYSPKKPPHLAAPRAHPHPGFPPLQLPSPTYGSAAYWAPATTSPSLSSVSSSTTSPRFGAAMMTSSAAGDFLGAGNYDAAGLVHYVMTVPESALGRAAVADLQQQTGARVAVARAENAGSGMGTRRVTISGSAEAVEAARRALAHKLAAHPKSGAQPSEPPLYPAPFY